jgi:PAS domain S-box-containing protein
MLPCEPSFFKLLADNSPLFIGMCDMSYTPFYMNDAGRRLVGLVNLEHFAKMPVKDFFFPEDQDFIVNQFFPRVLREGRAETEIRFRHFITGEAIWMTYDVFLLSDGSGKPVGLATMSRNIDESRRAAEDAAASRAKLKAAFASMAEAVFIADADGRVIDFNHEFIRYHRFANASECGQTIADCPKLLEAWFSDGTPAPLEQWVMSRALRGETAYNVEYRLRRKSTGETWWGSYNFAPIKDDVGKIVGAVVTAREITKLKEAEKSLQESKALLQIILDGVPDAIFLKDREGRMLLANPATLAVIGRPAELCIGKTDEEFLLDPDDAHAIMADDRRIMESGQAQYFAETLLTPFGKRCYLNSKTPFRDAEGRVVGLIGVARDVTELREAEAALREANRRKDEFIATLAHELRNPLSPIHNAVHVLKRKNGLSDKDARLLGMVERQTAHLVRLVDDLLDVSRIDSGKIELRREVVDINGILRNAVEACQPSIDKKGHKVTIRAPDAPATVYGDAVRLTQIAANLIGNAVKFTPPNGLIEVEAARQGEEAILRVRDNGVGVPAEMLSHVFDLFTQVGHSDDPGGGLGIGLALVRKLVEMHGGRVEAHSAGPGCGSEFIVRLPLENAQAPTAVETSGKPKKAKDDEAPRALVIDDDPDVGESFGLLLASAGAKVRVARSGLSGIAMMDAFSPDFVFIDIGMPEMDGYETARRIRSRAHDHPFTLIALTGWGQEEDRQRAQKAGFDKHLTKPAPLQSVEALLEQIRSTRRAESDQKSAKEAIFSASATSSGRLTLKNGS